MPQKKFSVLFKNKINKFNKIIKIDSDKSISIRSFLIASISHNISEVQNVLESEDVFSTIECLKKLGVKIKKRGSKKYQIFGKGLGSFYIKNNNILDCGNSGTLARLLIGILSTTPGVKVKIRGDKSLNKRNMAKLIDLMSQFGAEFFPKNKFNFPLTITSSAIPLAINYKAGISAQLKSAVILAALNSFGDTKIEEFKQSRDHTENFLLKSKNILKIKKNKKSLNSLIISGKKYLDPFKIKVPGDPSSSAFFTALTLLNENSKIKMKNVGLNPRRIGFYQLLKKHGAKIFYKNIRKNNFEITGDIIIYSSKIRPINAPSYFYPISTDEYPILFIIAALTKGISIFKGIEDLANKESNRIKEMQKILKNIGIKSKFKNNNLKIFGNNKINLTKTKINVPNLGDHRICMSVAVLSLITGINSDIKNFETVNTSSPSFLKNIKYLGGKYEIKKIS